MKRLCKPLGVIIAICGAFSCLHAQAAVIASNEVAPSYSYTPSNNANTEPNPSYTSLETATSTYLTLYVAHTGSATIYASGAPFGNGNAYCTATSTFTQTGYQTIPCNVSSGLINQGDSLYLSILNSSGGGTFAYGEEASSSPYFILSDASGTGSSTPSGWISPYIPANGSYSSSSPTTFSASYYFNCNTDYGIYDSVRFNILDSNTNQEVYAPPASILACGTSTLSEPVVLNTGHSYLWRPEIFSSSTTTDIIAGNWYFFQSTSTPAEDINTALGATIGTSSLPNTTNLLSFLNVPVLLQTKAPFAYIFQIASGIQQGISSSSTNAIPSGAFVWKGTNNATTTFDMFSTSTIGYYLSPTLVGLWRAFLLVVMTIEFGYGIYHTARKQLHI